MKRTEDKQLRLTKTTLKKLTLAQTKGVNGGTGVCSRTIIVDHTDWSCYDWQGCAVRG
jgi:hypothetical protein